jgi:ATP synthase protein I
MTTMPPVESKATQQDDWEDGAQEPEIKPLTREEAQQWRASQPVFSVWWLVGVQVLVGIFSGGVAWLLTWQAAVVWSVFYGAAAVVLPSALMAYGFTSSAMSRMVSGVAQAVLVALFFWEGAKILLTIAMLWMAPLVVSDLSWLGLLAGLVVTLKVYWFGFWFRSSRLKQNS